jgi:hypothetical protein
MRRPQPNAALADMLAKNGELDRILDGRGLTFTRSVTVDPPPAPPPPPPFRIEPPDWDLEHAEFVAREREARAREAAALLEAVEPPEKPTPPARRHRWKKGAE